MVVLVIVDQLAPLSIDSCHSFISPTSNSKLITPPVLFSQIDDVVVVRTPPSLTGETSIKAGVENSSGAVPLCNTAL